jgi:hypothetical protein
MTTQEIRWCFPSGKEKVFTAAEEKNFQKKRVREQSVRERSCLS